MESDISIWPAIVILLLQAMDTGWRFSNFTHGRYDGPKLFADFGALFIINGLLYWGGFFDVLLK